MSKIKDVKHHSLYRTLKYYQVQINYVQNKIIRLKSDIEKEIKHDKSLNITCFNPYVNEWTTELKMYRKLIQKYIESIKYCKSEIKNNQRFMKNIFN